MMRHVLSEIRRRKVHRAAILYAVGGLATVEASDLLFPRLQLPDWSVTLVLALVIVGFPLAMTLAWVFEIAPGGLVRTPSAEEAEPSDAPAPLRPAAARTHAREKTSILVAPFANGSPDPDNEYVGDGLTEEIITDLSKIRSLRVISRSSAMRLKGSTKTAVAMARELGLDYVLEGSVRKAGEDLRITIRLIDVHADEARWSERYRGTFDDLFEIQEQVARSVAEALALQVDPAEMRGPADRAVEDPRAIESYLRARYETFRFSAAGLASAERHLKNGLTVAGDSALLYTALGHVHAFRAQLGLDPDGAHLAKARECVERVFAIEPDSARGHLLDGLVHFQAGDFRAARSPFERALERRPDDPDALIWLGYLCALVGQHARALRLFERLLEVDPLTPINHAMGSFVAVLDGRPQDALDGYRTLLEMDPDSPMAWWGWFWTLLWNGRNAEAEAVARDYLARDSDSVFAVLVTARLHAERGETGDVREAISEDLRAAARTNELLSRELAHCFALAGQAEEALDWLENTIRIGNVNYPFWSRHDAWLEKVRGEARYAELMRQVEREWRSLNPELASSAGRPSGDPSVPKADAGERRASIVVLPFDNMSPDPGDAYFSDGLTEEIITHLSHLRSLRVISRSSAMTLKGTGKDVRTIGRELDVQYALEGSVRKAGDALRITAQLIDAVTDDHLWAEQYDGTLEDVFEMQERTSRAIVEALDLKLNPGEREKLTARPIESAQAYDCLLRARREAFKGTADGLDRALRDLDMGMRILGENALLLGGTAEVHLQRYAYGIKADEETLRQVEELAIRIDALEPASAVVHYLRGRIEANRGSTTGAIAQLARAVELDPNHTGAMVFLIDACSSHAGKPARADPLAARLLEIDPLTPLSVFIVGYHHWMAGRLNEALSLLQRSLALEPDINWMDVYLPYLLLWMDRKEDAAEKLTEIIHSDAPITWKEWASFLERALAGDETGTRGALSEATRTYLWNDPDAPWIVASTYALAGANAEALDWLEHALERGWINYPLFSEQDPLLEGIRGEERFEALITEVRARWEAFDIPIPSVRG